MRRLIGGAVVVLASCGGSGSSSGTSPPTATRESCEAMLRQPDGQNTSGMIIGCRMSGFDPVWEVKGVYGTDQDYDDWRAGQLDPEVEADDTIADTPVATGEFDSAGSRESCTHFRNVAGDYSNDLLTLPELRTKLQEVHERAEVASAAVRSASTAMLAAITAGDTSALIEAIKTMDVACKAQGY